MVNVRTLALFFQVASKLCSIPCLSQNDCPLRYTEKFMKRYRGSGGMDPFILSLHINLLTPNVNYSGRTAPLTSKFAFYIFIQQI